MYEAQISVKSFFKFYDQVYSGCQICQAVSVWFKAFNKLNYTLSTKNK